MIVIVTDIALIDLEYIEEEVSPAGVDPQEEGGVHASGMPFGGSVGEPLAENRRRSARSGRTRQARREEEEEEAERESAEEGSQVEGDSESYLHEDEDDDGIEDGDDGTAREASQESMGSHITVARRPSPVPMASQSPLASPPPSWEVTDTWPDYPLHWTDQEAINDAYRRGLIPNRASSQSSDGLFVRQEPRSEDTPPQ